MVVKDKEEWLNKNALHLKQNVWIAKKSSYCTIYYIGKD